MISHRVLKWRQGGCIESDAGLPMCADSGKRAAADFPGADLAVVKAMLGADICNKASNGAKQFTVCAS